MDHIVKTFPGVVALDVYSKKQGERSVIGMFMNANNRNQAAVATETAPATAEVDAAHPGHRSSRGRALPNDTLARAVLTSIGEKRERPVVAGQDSEDESVTLVAKGVQHSTIFKDTRNLVKQSIKLAEQLAKGEEPNLGDVKLDDKQYESM